MWWESVKEDNKDKDELVIYADNGAESNSQCTQFLLRMVEFVKQTGRIRLVYYPPYHSKYNPIERRWSLLERHWNGGLLNSVSVVMKWTRSLVHKCKQTIADLIESVYTKGVKPSKEKLAEIQAFIVRHAELRKRDVTIHPEKVYS